MKKIASALIGLGRIASLLEDDTRREKPATHAGAVSTHDECEIIAGADIRRERAEAFSKRWDCSNVYTDYRALLQNHSIDILHIATPPETHKEIIIQALEKHIPLIILEKPVSNTIEEAREILKLAESCKSKILINHERRYSLQYRRCKEVITNQAYGNLLSINSKLYMGRKRKLEEMLYDDGTHIMDLIHFLTDGFFTPSHTLFTEEGQLFSSGNSGGTPVLFEAGRGRDHLVFELDLSFERGRITVGNGYYFEYESVSSPFYENFRSLHKKDISFQYSRYFSEMYKDAVHCFKNSEAIPVSKLSDGVASLEAIELIISASRK